MSSMVVARADLGKGKNVKVVWDKEVGYAVKVTEPDVFDPPLWREVYVKRHATIKTAMSWFSKVVCERYYK